MELAYPNIKCILKNLSFEQRKALFKGSPKSGALRKSEASYPYKFDDFLWYSLLHDCHGFLIIGRFAIRFYKEQPNPDLPTLMIYGRIPADCRRNKKPWVGFTPCGEPKELKNLSVNEAVKQWIDYHLNRVGTQIEKFTVVGVSQVIKDLNNLTVTKFHFKKTQCVFANQIPNEFPNNFLPKEVHIEHDVSLLEPFVIQAEVVEYNNEMQVEVDIEDIMRVNCHTFRLIMFYPSYTWLMDFIRRLARDGKPIGYNLKTNTKGNMECATLDWMGVQIGARKTEMLGRKCITLDIETNPDAELNARTDQYDLGILWIEVAPKNTALPRDAPNQE